MAVDLAPATRIPTPPELVPVPRNVDRIEALPIARALGDLEKFAKRKFTPGERERWDGYLIQQSGSLASVVREIADARAELNDRVYRLFDLSDDEMRHVASEVGAGR